MYAQSISRWMTTTLFALAAIIGCSSQAPKAGPDAATAVPKPTLSWRETSEPVESAPISLTASDGSGLVLVSLKARTVIEEPLAFTELHLTFHNPEPRRREGRFAIALPQTAAISRFAMRVGSTWQEGEVVERKRAQAMYEDFLHRKQDPALLEQDAGNQFTARVFPIEAEADKELIVAYSEELPHSGEPYRLLLKGLPKLAELQADVLFGSSSATGLESTDRARGPTERLSLIERDHTPTADLAVQLPGRGAFALRSGELAVLRVAPSPKAEADTLTGLTVLFDTSASRALGFEAQIERFSSLLSELARRAGDFDLRVLAFDQTTEDIYSGPASGFSMRDKSRLLAREALGASDLAQALEQLARQSSRHERLLIVSDGVITAGLDDTSSLREAVAKLAAHGLRRVDALAEGGIRDQAMLTALTRAGLRSTGVVLDSRLTIASLANKLLQATRERVQVRVPDATWVYPQFLEGVQAGDESLIFVELPADKPLRVQLDQAAPIQPAVLETPRPLLERACARAKIEALTAELHSVRDDQAEVREKLSREIVALSVQQRVLSELTALLVLEGPSDYRRFGVAPTLTSILEVGEEGLVLRDRGSMTQIAQEVPADPRGPEPEAREDDARGEVLGRADAPMPTTEAEDKSPQVASPERSSDAKAKGASKDEVALETRRARSEAAYNMAAPQKSAAQPMAPPPSVAAPALGAHGSAGERGLAAGSALQGLGSIGSVGGSRSGAGMGGSGVQPRASTGSGGEGGARGPEPFDPPGAIVPSTLQARVTGRLQSAFGIDGAQAAQVVRGAFAAAARACYERAAQPVGQVERLAFEFSLSDKGTVASVFVARGALTDSRSQACILAAAERLRFPKPDAGNASLTAGLDLSKVATLLMPSERPTARAPRVAPKPPQPRIEDAYEGALAQTLEALARGDRQAARDLAEAAHTRDPGDVMSLIALGETLEAQGDQARAARAYGSLIDLFPGRTDLRRMAAARLERLPAEKGLGLAVDSYRKALAQRADQPSGHRLLAYALLKQGAHAEAFAVLEAALSHGFRWDRFEGVDRIFREDLALVAAAWLRTEPQSESRIQAALTQLGVSLDRTPSLRFVLNWETDANDVDFHIFDGRGGHAYYMRPRLPSGGSLYADITTGYGPECFAISGTQRAYPYTLQAHYFARGPMGFGMGKLEVIDHDGHGGLRFSEYPFAIMKDKAFVQLALLQRP